MDDLSKELEDAKKRIAFLEKYNAELINTFLAHVKEHADLGKAYAPFPEPAGYVSEQDLAALRSKGGQVSVSLACEPAHARYYPIYLHPHGGELERFKRLAFLWSDAMQVAEGEMVALRLEKFLG